MKTNLKKLLLKASLVALLAPTVLLTACDTSSEVGVGADTATEIAEEENVTVEELSRGAEDLIGQEISIRGEVDGILQDGAFLLDDDTWFGGEDVLAINLGEPIILPDDDSEVQVTGEVVQFILADIERDYSLGLDPELYAEYEDRPAILAQSIALAPDPEEISENPGDFYNRVIAVEGEVEEVYADGSFTIDEEAIFGAEDLLVVRNGAIIPTEGETVAVTGVLRPFIKAEFDRDYELGWDLNVQQQLEAEYESKPVLVADAVYPSAK